MGITEKEIYVYIIKNEGCLDISCHGTFNSDYNNNVPCPGHNNHSGKCIFNNNNNDDSYSMTRMSVSKVIAKFLELYGPEELMEILL